MLCVACRNSPKQLSALALRSAEQLVRNRKFCPKTNCLGYRAAPRWMEVGGKTEHVLRPMMAARAACRALVGCLGDGRCPLLSWRDDSVFGVSIRDFVAIRNRRSRLYWWVTGPLRSHPVPIRFPTPTSIVRRHCRKLRLRSSDNFSTSPIAAMPISPAKTKLRL